MPNKTILDGHRRQTLFKGIAASITGSTGLGTYDTAKYSRFIGVFSVVGSVNFRWRMGVESGNFQVNSSVTINSGSFCFDQLNFGRYPDFAFVAANSQVLTYAILGEPLR